MALQDSTEIIGWYRYYEIVSWRRKELVSNVLAMILDVKDFGLFLVSENG
jgi:hypothetical protein